VDFETFIQVIHVAAAIAVFVACLVVRAKRELRPIEGARVGLGLIAFGAAFQFIAFQMGGTAKFELGPFLLMQRGTIWHGTTFLAIGYGLLAYSVVRAMGVPRRGDG
jgi:hypothetical protein